MTTADKPHLVRLQLVGTKSSWQGRAVAIIAALQMLETWPRSRKSWPRQYGHADHQLDDNTCPVPKDPYWISGKSTQILDKWTLFSDKNINALTLTGAKPSLDPINHIFIYLLCIHSIILCNLLHLLSTFIAPLLTLAYESIWQVSHRCHPTFS